MAYTYLIKHIPTNKFYYGCRYAKDSRPEDLWVTYFTSSNSVKSLIEEYGKDSFTYEVRKIFDDEETCRQWETKVLKRMKVTKREDFLNATDNVGISHEHALRGKIGRKPSKKLVEAWRKVGLSNKGRTHPDETRQRISEALLGNKYRLGKPDSEETRLKKSLSKIGKPSNAVGNTQPRTSCILCKHVTTTSNIKRHYLYHHGDKNE